MSYREEPIYENIQKDIENVQEIDERVLNFLHVVKQAPQSIQVATDNFLVSLDKLKKSYILNIVKSKKVERKYNDASRYLARCQRDFDYHKFQDDYLNQVSPELEVNASKKVEIAKLECSMSYCQLQLAVRELELSKEKLCRLSKRAEHLFISTLRNHSDKGWIQLYRNELHRNKSELKRVRTIPGNTARPELVNKRDEVRGNACNKCSKQKARRSSIDSIPPGTHGKRSGKYLVKSPSLDSYSSDEDFPPPPSPPSLKLHEQIVTVDVIAGKKKRFSDRSTVDEGIGDIDWKPWRPTSDGSSSLTDPLEKELIKDLDRITHLADTLSRIPPEKLAEISPDDILEGTANLMLDESKTEDIIQNDVNPLDSNQVIPIDTNAVLEISDFPEIPRDLQLNPDQTPESMDHEIEKNVTPRTSTPENNYAKLTSYKMLVEVDINAPRKKSHQNKSNDSGKTDENSSEVISSLHDVNELPCDADKCIETETGVMSSNCSTSNLTSVKDVSDKTITNVLSDHDYVDDDSNNNGIGIVINTTIDPPDDISIDSDCSHFSYYMDDDRKCRDAIDRKEHVYEDVLRFPDYAKKNEKRKKSKLNFLTKVFHGPWEGWEDT